MNEKNTSQHFNPPLQRRFDLDWLRVLAFSLLIFYHVGMFFNYWGWHVKNNILIHSVEWPMRFSSQWRMALLFMISGAGVYLALQQRSPGAFLKERFIRIFIPLFFGMLFIVPPQIYFERLIQGENYNYIDFSKTVFDFIPYPKGNFSWHHLWYLAYIFVYSVLALPLFLFIKHARKMTAWLARFFSSPLTFILIPVLWHALGEIWLSEEYPTTHNLIRDWNNHFHAFTLFLTGFILCSHTSFWKTLSKYRKLTTTIWIVLTITLYTVYWIPDREIVGREEYFYWFIKTTNAWCVLLSFFGLAYTYLQFSNPFLKYANEAVYPFYILHQTVIVCLAYPIINSQLPIYIKFIYLTIATFFVCFILYHFLIRKINILRILFGMKPIKKHRQETPVILSSES